MYMNRKTFRGVGGAPEFRATHLGKEREKKALREKEEKKAVEELDDFRPAKQARDIEKKRAKAETLALEKKRTAHVAVRKLSEKIQETVERSRFAEEVDLDLDQLGILKKLIEIANGGVSPAKNANCLEHVFFCTGKKMPF